MTNTAIMMVPRQRKEVDTSTYSGRFAVRLRELREKKKMTVDELAEKSGIPRSTLFNWESTSRSPVSEDLPKIAKALGVDVGTLMPKE